MNGYFANLVDNEYLVSLASPEGAMVLFRCDHQYLGELAGAGVIPGSVWTEDQQGTNGVGTCLRVGKAVTIAGTQHYGSAIQRLTCMTAPILGRNGVIESAINVTTARHADGRVNRMVQNIIERSARRIENGVFGRLNRRNLLLRIIDSGEISDIAEEGRLALDENGRILDGSSFVGSLLKMPVGQLLGQSAEDLLEMDQALSDIRPDAPINLTYRGRSLQAVLSLPEVPRRTPQRVVSNNAAERPLRFLETSEVAIQFTTLQSQVLERACRLLSVGLPLVVSGESGTGKTTFARSTTRNFFGKESAVVLIDGASPDASLDLGSLLHRDLLQQSCCLVIDRFDEMDSLGQTALLALLENHWQAGSKGIGVIVISSIDLEQLVAEKRMRSDLMHRLNGGQIELPPLRASHDLEAAILDLLLIEHKSLGKPRVELDDDARMVLTHHHWPGNLRELRNTLRHAVALVDGKLIRLEHLPESIVAKIAGKDLTARSQSEASKIEVALRYNGGNVSLTARYLGVSRATLYRKIQIQKARGETR